MGQKAEGRGLGGKTTEGWGLTVLKARRKGACLAQTQKELDLLCRNYDRRGLAGLDDRRIVDFWAHSQNERFLLGQKE